MSKAMRTYDQFKPKRDPIAIAADCVRNGTKLNVEAGNCIKRLHDELIETRKLLEQYGKTGLERLNRAIEKVAAPSPAAADEPIVEKRQVCIICNRPCPIRVCGMCVDAIESPT